MEQQTLTTKQVADIFAVHPNTVVKWANDGLLACFRTPGRHRRYPLEAVLALKAQTEATPVPAA